MIKYKIGELINAKESINFLLEQKIPVKASFKLSRILKDIVSEINSYEEARHRLVLQYGEKDKNDENKVVVSKENWDRFSEELKPLQDQEIDINKPKILINELESLEIPPKYMMDLMPIFVENDLE